MHRGAARPALRRSRSRRRPAATVDRPMRRSSAADDCEPAPKPMLSRGSANTKPGRPSPAPGPWTAHPLPPGRASARDWERSGTATWLGPSRNRQIAALWTAVSRRRQTAPPSYSSTKKRVLRRVERLRGARRGGAGDPAARRAAPGVLEPPRGRRQVRRVPFDAARLAGVEAAQIKVLPDPSDYPPPARRELSPEERARHSRAVARTH
jgi:hypothetical protein